MKFEDDGFDPTPYDRILTGIHRPAVIPPTEIAGEKGKNIENARNEKNLLYDLGEKSGENKELVHDSTNTEGAKAKNEKRMPIDYKHYEKEESAKKEAESLPNTKEVEMPIDYKRYQKKELGQISTEDICNVVVEDEIKTRDNMAETYEEMDNNSRIEDSHVEIVLPEVVEPERIEASLLHTPMDVDITEKFEALPLPIRDEKNTKSEKSIEHIERGQNLYHKFENKEKGRIIPLNSVVISDCLKYTNIVDLEAPKVYIEEDILVPDVKPDMLSILSMSADVTVQRNDLIKLSGEILLNTIYTPIDKKKETIEAVSSKIPFRTDIGDDISALSTYIILPEIESIEYKVVNERKFRVKIAVVLNIKEYSDVSVECFAGIKGEEIEILKENINVTSLVSRKTEEIEIEETLPLKEGMPEPLSILKKNLKVSANHKQISSEKAVVNATIYCNLIYMAEMEPDEEGIRKSEPILFQGKSEFTQFMPLDMPNMPSGSKISFDENNLDVEIADAEAGGRTFKIKGSISTCVEVFGNSDREIVTDIYHSQKDLECDRDTVKIKSLAGSGTTEISAREIFTVPEKYSEIEKILYVDLRTKDSLVNVEQNKASVSGMFEAEALCKSAEEGSGLFTIKKEIPFRGNIDITGIAYGMIPDYNITLRDLWFDKISGKQVEINASVLVSALIWKEAKCDIIKNPYFIQREETNESVPSMVVYVSRPEENLWKIAKKFKASVDEIAEINGIEQSKPIKAGSKILIVR